MLGAGTRFLSEKGYVQNVCATEEEPRVSAGDGASNNKNPTMNVGNKQEMHVLCVPVTRQAAIFLDHPCCDSPTFH